VGTVVKWDLEVYEWRVLLPAEDVAVREIPGGHRTGNRRFQCQRTIVLKELHLGN
jgi:hypothetical protein